MKYFVVVGGTRFQSELIKAAQKKGFVAICIDKNPNSFCFDMLNIIKIEKDILDHKGVIEALCGYNIVGAETVQSDIGVPLVSRIKDHFGLSVGRIRAGDLFSNKYNFRKYLYDKKLSAYKPMLIDCNSRLENIYLEFPVALKPVDSSGSRGVFKCYNLKDLNEKIPITLGFSRTGGAILEPWFEGVEYGAQVLVDTNGNPTFLFHEDYLFNNIPVAHCIKMAVSEEIVISRIKEMISDLHLNNCVLNVDLIKTSKDIEILEIGLRLGATELDSLATHHLGLSVYDWILNPEKISLDSQATPKTFGVLFNPYSETITLRKDVPLSGKFKYDDKELNFSIDLEGECIGPFTDGTMRFGSFSKTGNLSKIKLEEYMKLLLRNLTLTSN
jgi:hypothetical protein